ncbi:MAG: hypothetical protein AAGE52_42005, partial [Myxococcota bacterium]
MRFTILLVVLAWGTATEAQTPPKCFGGEEVRSVPLTLGARVTLDAGCEFARDPGGPFRRLRDRPFVVDVLEGLGWQPGDSTTVYGRPAGDPTQLTSVFVDHCSDYLLAPGGAFQVRPGSERGALDVVRVSSRCGASALQLRFVCPMRDAPEAV